MRGVSKTLIAAVAVLLLALGLAACGGGDDSSSTTTEAVAKGQAEGKASESGSAQDKGKAKDGAEGSGSGVESKGQSSGSDGGESGSSGSGNFVPKHHKDSGGGAKQFEVKGGDNSVQEYGTEAEPTELNAAAVALHNFLDARAAGDWAAACGYLSKTTTEGFEKLAAQAKQVEDTSCAGILGKLTNPAAKQSMQAEAEQANVGSLRIEGGRAFVIYTGIGGTVLAMPMASEGGVWKVASLAGTPLS